MTPYAILLVKPTDPDDVIRKAYHKHAETQHPDRNGGVPGPQWKVTTDAYTAIKTEDARNNWALRLSLMAGVCENCDGSGVKGTRMFKGKIRLCEECKGVGRVLD